MRAPVGLALRAACLFAVFCCSQHGQVLPQEPNTFPTSTDSQINADRKARMDAERLRQAFQKMKDAELPQYLVDRLGLGR